MSESKFIDPRNLRPGPIRNESLPDHLLLQIKPAYNVIGPYLDMTLEQFEIGFMRDMHPEREIAVWIRIAGAWQGYHEQHLRGKKLSRDDERNLIGSLIAISSGVEDLSKLKVHEDVGRKLIACYREMIDE